MGGGVHRTGNHAVGLFLVDHHGAVVGAVGHLFAGLFDGDALLGAKLRVGFREVFKVGGGHGIDDFRGVHVHAEFRGAGVNLFGIAEQDDFGHLALKENGGSLDEAVFFAFGQHDAHGMLLGLFDEAEFKEAGRDVAVAGIEDGSEGGGLAAHGEGEIRGHGLFIFFAHAGEEHAEQFHALFLHLALEGGDGGGDFGGRAAFAGKHEHHGSAHVGGHAGVEGIFKGGAPAGEVGAFAEHEIGLGGGFLVGGENGIDEFVALAAVDEFKSGLEAGNRTEQNRGLGGALDEIHQAGDGFGLAGIRRKSGDEKRACHGKNSFTIEKFSRKRNASGGADTSAQCNELMK